MSLCVSGDGRWVVGGWGGGGGGGVIWNAAAIWVSSWRAGPRRSSLAVSPPTHPVPRLHSRFTRSSDLGDTGRSASRPQSLRGGQNRWRPNNSINNNRPKTKRKLGATYQLACLSCRGDFNESGRRAREEGERDSFLRNNTSDYLNDEVFTACISSPGR